MDLNQILEELDKLYAEASLDKAELRLGEWLAEAEEAGEQGIMLALYNEQEGLYRTTGRAPEAVKVSARALELVRRLGLEGGIQHAATLQNAATANRAAGNADEALAMFEEAAAMYGRLGKEGSYQMAALNNNISQIYQEREEHDTALSYLEKALAVVERLEGGAAEAATTRINMSLSLMALDRLEEAKQRIDEAMEYYRSEQGLKDAHYPSALSAAGELAFCNGEKKEALALIKEALDVTLRIFGENAASEILRRNVELIEESIKRTEQEG